MTTPGLAVLLVAAATAVTDWRAVMVGARRVEYVAKPATLLLLIVLAFLLEPVDTTQRDWFVAALVASLIGDVALMLPSASEPPRSDGATASSQPATFLVGLSAFLIAHIGYLGGFLLGELEPVGLAVGLGVALGVGVVAGSALVRVTLRDGDLVTSIAIAAYLVVIGAMVVVAYGSGRPLAMAGATLFLVSDTLIGWNRFVRPVPSARLMIMSTYHLGQAGLVVSLLG